MIINRFHVAGGSLLFFCVFNVSAATVHYVDASGMNPIAPYTSWATAATNIQDAVNASAFNDTILVTNGLYQYGGDLGAGSNRVDVSSGMVQSVNGPAVTVIEGYQVPGTTNGAGAVRCVNLREFARLSGFTLTNGATSSSGGNGGGVLMASDCIVSNCIITGNASSANGAGVESINNALVVNCAISGNIAMNGSSGGGVYGCTVVNCIISNNLAGSGGGVASCTVNDSLLTGNGRTNYTSGGGAYLSTLYNCTLAGNRAGSAAANGCTLDNSIIYYNVNGNYADCYQCNLTNCCTTLGNGNSSTPNGSISNAPGFVNLAGGDFHLNPWSPCIDAGNSAIVTNSTDLDGNPRIVGAAVDMGCYESQNTNAVHYVSLSNAVPVSPFTNWLTAATNIQDAVDAAVAGDFVVVSNGVYDYGERAVFLSTPNRVAVEQPVTVQSLNGPVVTAIAGSAAFNIRCVYLTNGAVLSGFTLTNGNSMTSGDPVQQESGGGAFCEGSGSAISNCIFVANSATRSGGGAFRGTLLGCTLTNNAAGNGGGACSNVAINCVFTHNKASMQNFNYGGGAYGCWLSNCLLVANQSVAGSGFGGGAAYSTLTACVVSNNSAGASGGGIYMSTAGNSLISSNRAVSFGGGGYSSAVGNSVFANNVGIAGNAASQCVLNNCLITNHNATQSVIDTSTMNDSIVARCSSSGFFLIYNSRVDNCTIVSNTGAMTTGSTWLNSIVYFNGNSGTIFTMSNCCAFPPPMQGFGNITNDPAFVNLANGDFHLQSSSPCINSGNNAWATNAADFDGNPRIAGGTVDMGAYEFQNPSSVISYAWLQQYGLPTDGSADYTNLDGTAFNVYQDWIAGLNPTNPASVLAMLAPTPTNNTSGIIVTWQSVTNVTYYLQRSSDLAAQPAFSAIQSNIVGQAGSTSYTDASATNDVPYFYRVGVQ